MSSLTLYKVHLNIYELGSKQIDKKIIAIHRIIRQNLWFCNYKIIHQTAQCLNTLVSWMSSWIKWTILPCKWNKKYNILASYSAGISNLIKEEKRNRLSGIQSTVGGKWWAANKTYSGVNTYSPNDQKSPYFHYSEHNTCTLCKKASKHHANLPLEMYSFTL